jgi:predicted CXXCH cytochrome family protein
LKFWIIIAVLTLWSEVSSAQSDQSDQLVLPGANVTKGAAPGYVEDRICATCHQPIYDSYQHVGMAQSFKRPDEALPMEDFGSEFYHAPSDRYYQMSRRDDGLYFRRYQRGRDGGVLNELEIPVAWVMGSGNRARSYLYQTEWGELYLLPIGWYSETDSWGMSPGFEDADHPGIHRRVERECMFCHNAFPEVPAGSDVNQQVEVFPHNLPQGTGCQRCHGPGAEHIRRVANGDDLPAIHEAIINPGRLASEQRDSVCFQCHMLPSANLVGARRFGRGDYSFIPGQDLSDYLVHVDITEHEADPADRFEINHHGYRFFQSHCFRESEGRLACITCHDPHVKPETSSFRANVAEVCSSCHENSESQHEAGAGFRKDACVTCHMPQRRTRDVIHVTMTDHLISRGPFDLDELVKPINNEHRAVTGVNLLPLGSPPVGDEALIYRMIAALRAGRNVEVARHGLEQALDKTTITDPTPYMDLATAQLETGQFEAAEATTRRLIAQNGNLHAAYTSLGIALMAQDKGEEAISMLKRSLELQPDPETHFNLAAGYLRVGQYSLAEGQIDAAIKLRPYMAIAWKYKALLLDSRGARLAARDALVRALQLEPLDLSVFEELIKLLRELGDYTEADLYEDLAIRISQSLQGAPVQSSSGK